MDAPQIADLLEELAESLGLEISYEPIRPDEELGTRPEGFCLFKGRRLIIVNPHVSLREKIRTLSEGIKHCDLERIYIRPILRELLDAIPGHRPPVIGTEDRESDEKPIDVEG
jgi:hypothetical protein